MSLTAEQWFEGRRKRDRLMALATKFEFGSMPSPGDVEFRRASDDWKAWTIMHADTLLECSQPKCGECGGAGIVSGFDVDACPDCNGTGLVSR